MKYIVIALSGIADQPTEDLGDRTPLEMAKVPNLNYFAKLGKVGQVKLVPDKFEPAPDTTFLNLLGYDADKVYTGIGPLEAANLDLKLDTNEVAFRMNFITESEGRLADPTAGKLSTKEARALINFLNKKVANDFIRFFAGSEYRHVAVIKDSHGYEALSARAYCPDAVVGQKIEDYFPKGPGDELLKKMMLNAKLLLQDHEINQVRVDLQENPANMIWLWGQGRAVNLEKFQDKRGGLSGAVISRMEYIKGVGRAAGMTVMELPDATGDPEDDYDKKAKAVLAALEDKDFVCLQIHGCDEASRLGDVRAKISVLEAVDFFVLSKIKKYLEDNKQVRILFTSCHASPWKTRKHTRDSVPFLVTGKNITPDDIEEFSEAAAKASEIKLKSGSDLMEFFISK